LYNVHDFEDDIEEILESELLDKESKNYLKKKYEEKKKWVRCYLKSQFCCGNCTTSRIESKHRQYKRFLNSSSRLSELFKVFQNIETEEMSKFTDEIAKITQKENNKLNKFEIIKFCAAKYSNFVVRLLKDVVLESVNYKVEKRKENLWYIFFPYDILPFNLGISYETILSMKSNFTDVNFHAIVRKKFTSAFPVDTSLHSLIKNQISNLKRCLLKNDGN